MVINDFFKHSPDNITPIYTRLFNVVLASGQVPDDWCLGRIKPIYKNKGDEGDPNNYRGKLFTSCINKRLTCYVEDKKTVGAEQAGFKSDFSTVDNIFVLKSLADLYLNKRKRLHCCYVDYQKALDTVNRSKLWTKLLSMGMAGKMIEVIKNMYSKAKSVVSVQGVTSSSFHCNIGVRQGENLSPLLFSIYLADFKLFWLNNVQA